MPIDIESLMTALKGRPGGVASGGKTFPMDAIRRRVELLGGTPQPDMGETDMGALQGMPDPRGMTGILSRGSNVYNGASNAAQQGGGDQFGRPAEGGLPPRNAILRRIQEQRGGHGLFA